MRKTDMKKICLTLLLFAYLIIFTSITQAASITTCTLDRDIYRQGGTGYLTVTVYNDQEAKIRAIELTATIDYYYADGNTYLQTFYTDETLPAEIQPGESESLHIPFSLPTNIASGFTDIFVKTKTELWNNHSQLWFQSDHPTYRQTLFIESPYKQQFEDQQVTNDQLEEQLSELQTLNNTTTTMTYILGITTIIFAVMTALLFMLNRKTRGISQPLA